MNCAKFGEFSFSRFGFYRADKQTDRQTDRQTDKITQLPVLQ